MKGCSRKSSDWTFNNPGADGSTLNERLLPKEQRRPPVGADKLEVNPSMKGCSRKSSDAVTFHVQGASNPALNERLLPKEQRLADGLYPVAYQVLPSMKGCSRKSSDREVILPSVR